ncbi:penicillin-binding transpeptidase domain-containing protein [Rugamonas rubra]|uniref:beta-lactamase n=1 Tax=Rugamonas rubra TaxID=758825 RepID=A0A1I4TD04_9BURK|nr:penicillin-binding transpeptidase domain-containing protein [Rugamonas rubra]SFM74572.1 Penicillin binding protein transpeptidase domain-containing protein [Rugamonas rubra]
MAERRRARRRLANLRFGAARARGATLRAVPAASKGADIGTGTGRGGSGAYAARARAPKARLWTPARLAGLGAVAAALAGAALIAGHARHLGAATVNTPAAAQQQRVAEHFQAALPGAEFAVPQRAGISLGLQPAGAVLVAAGMQAAPAVRLDLCGQLRNGGNGALLPLRLGYRFDDVRRWVARNEQSRAPLALRNVLLVRERAAGSGQPAMPEVEISGRAMADFADPLATPLQLNWRNGPASTRWLGDASLGQPEQGTSARVGLRQQGWLLWGGDGVNNSNALRIERRASALCPQAGELVLQMYQLPDAGAGAVSALPASALVTAFPARGQAVSTYLTAGQYRVPAAPRAELEDQSLFQSLQQRGLVRLAPGGAVELAPRDLLQWSAAGAADRAGDLAAWRAVPVDAATRKLIKRLYHQADGEYVRQQVDIFNGERRLLAWRGRDGAVSGWRASVVSGGVDSPLPASAQMPGAATRVFAQLPQGWQPWTRVARWPQAPSHPAVRLTLELAGPAAGGEQQRLLLLGRARAATGARMQALAACSGRACAAADDAQELTLTLLPGARSVQLDVEALAVDTPQDQKYRHLRLAAGRLLWQQLPDSATAAGPAALAPSTVLLQDRNGTLLWADGAPTQPALDAGLATLLGVGPEHASGVAGMLARLPSASGGPLAGRLTLDLPLQTLSQRVLDCVGMRRGRWDGAACVGGQAAPERRHAGLVILDTETGDVLAAAGAGTGAVTGANWAEVRDFDRSNPARSPLRLPALQHDGGAHQSPGSTFKVVSALGLELAAVGDPQLDGLLGGLPLAAINRIAQQRGFAFQTDAATYPLDPRRLQLAHITNYKEQSLDRRAQDGKLGLAQALTYSLNTWFAWSSELSDRSLFGRPDGGAPDLQALDAGALDSVRPILAAAHRLGFEQALRLDGGLLPADYRWSAWDALQTTPAHIDPIHSRHELRQMAIGLRMQATPLQMALAAGAVGQGRVVAPRLLLALDGRASKAPLMAPLGIRLDRIRAGMKGVVDVGTGAGAFAGPALAELRHGLYGKTGTAPTGEGTATVWFTGWLEPGSLPGQTHRLALAAFVSHSEASGGEHAAPMLAALLTTLVKPRPMQIQARSQAQSQAQSQEQRVK